MDSFLTQALIKTVTLNQRDINCRFKKETGINKTCIEILTFASTVLMFNPYIVQRKFNSMNLQQVRLGIKYLRNIAAVELIKYGYKNKPAVYMITEKGEKYY